jgi:hypothetical protein
MTEKPEDQTAEPTADDVQETDTVDNPDETVDNPNDTEGGKLHREAAKYRTQLRETEAELETMTGQRNQLAAQVIEHQLGNLKPNVFWKLAGDVTDYINDDGTVNLEKVTKTAKTIGDDLGINTGPTIPGQEKRPGKINAGNKLHQAFEPR